MNLPPALPLRYASFMYFFVLLMQAAFSFRPRLLLWTGLSGVGRLDARLSLDRHPARDHRRPGRRRAAQLPVYFDRNFASLIKFQNEVIVFLLVSAGLALLVRRSRSLVAERAAAERARGNLSRYFSPKVVDTLAERDEPLGRVRRQAVGRALRRSRGLHDDGRGHDARRGHGVAARFPRPDGRGGVSLQRLPGEVHRRRAAGDVRCARDRPARRHRHAGLRARHAGRAARVESGADGGRTLRAAHGARPALRPGRGRRHRQPTEHGLRDRGRHHQRHQPPAGAHPGACARASWPAARSSPPSSARPPT